MPSAHAWVKIKVIVFLSAGVGITPTLAMLEAACFPSLAAPNDPSTNVG